MTFSRVLVALLGIAASLIASPLIIYDYHELIDMFQLAGKTDFGSVYFHLGGLLANGAVIFVALAILLRRPVSGFGLGLAVIVFVPLLLGAVTVLLCSLKARPGVFNFCGVWLFFVSLPAIPIVLAAATAFIWASHSRLIKAAGAGAAFAFIAVASVAKAWLSPTEPGQCQRFPEVTKRSYCLDVFAERGHDEALCRLIEFRAIRFSCLREIAVSKGDARLCEEIRDQSPIKAYESPAASYRDACLQDVASHHAPQ